MNTKKIGDYGERCAARYLRFHGFRIVERNYRSKISELDIIAYDGDCLCFVEVKTRSRRDYGLAAEAVDFKKQQRIIRGARQYLAANNITCPVRFDVAEVYIEKGLFLRKGKVNLIKNAFWA